MFPSLVKPTFAVRSAREELSRLPRPSATAFSRARWPGLARWLACKIADLLRLWPRLDWPNRLVAGLDPVILIYALQAIYSRCWPKRFSCRPIERFWRLVVYGRRPVFVRGLPNRMAVYRRAVDRTPNGWNRCSAADG